MNLELLSRAIERILSSKYDVEVSVDVRSEVEKDESAGCSESICRDRIRYEIKCGRLEKRRQEVTEEQIQSIVSRYKAGMSLNNIAKEMLMSRYQVTNILKEQGEKQ